MTYTKHAKSYPNRITRAMLSVGGCFLSMLLSVACFYVDITYPTPTDLVENDNASLLAKYLADGLSPNWTDEQGFSLISKCIVHSATNCFLLLIRHGAELERTASGLHPPPVVIAKDLNQPWFLQKLVQYHAPKTFPDPRELPLEILRLCPPTTTMDCHSSRMDWLIVPLPQPKSCCTYSFPGQFNTDSLSVFRWPSMVEEQATILSIKNSTLPVSVLCYTTNSPICEFAFHSWSTTTNGWNLQKSFGGEYRLLYGFPTVEILWSSDY